MPRRRVSVPDRYRTRRTSFVAETDVYAETVDGLPTGWNGVIAVESIPTGDGRLMEPGSLRWGDLPIPLRDAPTDEGEHRGAVVVGQITEIRRDGTDIYAVGTFDLTSPEGREAARKVGSGIKTGVSVDLDDVDLEVRVAADVLDQMEGEVIFDDAEPSDQEPDADGRVTVVKIASDDEMLVTTDGRIRAATIVDIPAFIEARIEPATDVVLADDDASVPAPDEEGDLLASGLDTARPPADWFDDPSFGTSPADDPRLTVGTDGQVGCPLTIDDDGRVYGHVALWQTCHTAYPNECVSPPTSATGYSYFRVGAVRTREGFDVPTGRLTLDTLHAARRSSAVDTLAHYENTGFAAADVSAGEDAHGIWIAGRIRPGAKPEQVEALRASPLSGDWRRVGGNLELVAVLAVNSPGFPVPRALVASGDVHALQSAGALHPSTAVPGWDLPDDDAALLRRMAQRERTAIRARRASADSAHRRVVLASAAARIRGAR
ncbi:MAG: hypothetical protein ABR616_18295 [Dermatophilaceae bacterium]